MLMCGGCACNCVDKSYNLNTLCSRDYTDPYSLMRTDIKLTVRNNFCRTHLQFEVIGDMAKPIGLWQISRSGSCAPKYQRPKVFWRIPINIAEKGFYMVQDYGSTYVNFFVTRLDGVN